MAIQEVRVGSKADINGPHEGIFDVAAGQRVPYDTATVYRLEGITEDEAETLRIQALTNPVTEQSKLNSPHFDPGTTRVLEIGYKPGVMNPVEASLNAIADALHIYPVAVASSTEYGVPKDTDDKTLHAIGLSLLSQVQHIIERKPETLLIDREPGPVQTVAVAGLSEQELTALSTQRRLFLNAEEMRVIQDYFARIGREPTDIEVEMLAQTWSEHNGHKTFKARLITPEGEKEPLISRIRRTSEKYFEKVGVVTAFKDNAGGFRFYDGMAIIAKGETHNSPVAVEPYGGSLTKNGGVYRDIAGCGLGGTNFLGLMINCFASPTTETDKVPPGCLPPLTLLTENSRGERDYGNRMGIPTHAISLHFHPDFVAKPTSLGVVVGMIEEENSQKGQPLPGDLLISVGGRTGRDGIHGATFSSGGMTAETRILDSTAVQIGNPIEEKRTFDALLACKDAGLIRALTDCGGGGYSSAIGEIAEDVGVEVRLDQVPLKYQGLAPWEIWLSESQERMIVALDPENRDKFEEICRRYNAPVTQIGRFTGDHQLRLTYGEKIVGELPMNFLHHGLPQRTMQAEYVPYPEYNRVPEAPTDWVDVYKKVLSHLNVCSTEPVLRRYDQTVQGRTVHAPFTGIHQDVPNDASVVAPLYGKPYGVVTGFGLNPILNRIDPYWGSMWAATEAVANLTASGGNPHEAALIDNFIWPFPDKESLGSLDRSVDALCDFMDTLRIPCVSGKDSLSSTYRGKDGTVTKIPPVLNITAFGKIPDVSKTVTVEIKSSNSVLCFVGKMDVNNLGGSVYFDTQDMVNSHLPHVALKALPDVLNAVHQAIQSGDVKSCHDVGAGGLAVTLAEMAFGGDVGVEVNVGVFKAQRPDFAFFNETAGCFVVEVESDGKAHELFGSVAHQVIGKTKPERTITVSDGDTELMSADMSALKEEWKKPLTSYF